MAINFGEFRKTAEFPKEGTPEFMVVMGRSLKAYNAALDVLINAMAQVRDSFMEMIEIHYGLDIYEEFLKDNFAAEKAKEMRPDIAERTDISGLDQQEDQEKHYEVKEERDRKMRQEEPVELPDSSQNVGNPLHQDPEEFFEKQAGDANDADPYFDTPYAADPGTECMDVSQPEEKRRGR